MGECSNLPDSNNQQSPLCIGGGGGVVKERKNRARTLNYVLVYSGLSM